MSIRKRLTTIAAAALLAVSLASCGTGNSAGSSPTCPGGEITFGVEPYEDPAKLIPAYRVLTNALQDQLGCPVTMQVVTDYSAEVLAMRNGKLELAQFGPLGYVFASRKAGAEPLVSFADSHGNLTTYTAGIWVPKNSPIRGLRDLRGHSLALSSPGSTSGDALPRYALRKAGIPKKSVNITYAGGHPQSLLALVNGKVDAAEINSQQLSTAKKAGKFDPSDYRRIWKSEPIPNDPITVRGDMDPVFKKAVQRALLNLSPQTVAKVGALLGVNPPGPLVKVSKQTYHELFELANTLGLTEKDG